MPKQTGVNYNAGIWHFPLISMKDMNFLIVDRKGKGNNLVIYKFKKDKIILKKWTKNIQEIWWDMVPNKLR